MFPIPLLFLTAYVLKKMDDRRRSYISEEDYRRLQREADERDGKTQPALTDQREKM